VYKTLLIKERENIIRIPKANYKTINGWVLRAHYDGYTVE
jgi:hypothetical protein